MRLCLIAVGERVPAWVAQGFEEYAGRLRQPWTLKLKEIPAERRSRNADIARLVRAEGERLLAAVPTGWRMVALDPTGYQWGTETLARHLGRWTDEAQNAALLVGGPDGLSADLLEKVNEVWALSPLTLAHSVVRVVVAEQIYRAFSIVHGLPYHRGAR
jgi:23S rRNA (pseudouridine1915-N3)-methyltransferase